VHGMVELMKFGAAKMPSTSRLSGFFCA